MRTIRALAVVASAAVLTAAAVYLHDPPWAGAVTSGLRPPQTDASGVSFRWTTGRASFFVPSDAAAMTLQLRPRAPLSTTPITVDVNLDDRRLATIELPDPLLPDPDHWVRTVLPLPRRATSRRFRRVDLRVHRWLEQFHLGVQLGPVEIERANRRP